MRGFEYRVRLRFGDGDAHAPVIITQRPLEQRSARRVGVLRKHFRGYAASCSSGVVLCGFDGFLHGRNAEGRGAKHYAGRLLQRPSVQAAPVLISS